MKKGVHTEVMVLRCMYIHVLCCILMHNFEFLLQFCNTIKMKKLAQNDLLIKRMATDLAKKLGDEEGAYRIVFNSEVLGRYRYGGIV